MDILISGSIAYDYLMRYSGRFADSLVEQKLDKVSLSFLVHDMTRHYGGVAGNIVYSMALLGYRPRLMGAVGQDFDPYRQRLDAMGVDTSLVRVIDELFTASFFCNTDMENNQIASFYAGAMGQAGDFSIADVTSEQPDLVAITPDDPRAMAARVEECRKRGIDFLFDPSQQVATLDGDFLRHGIEHCSILMCNEYEWSVIEKRTGLTLDGLQDNGHVFIHTLGADGSNIYQKNETIHIPAVVPERVLDPTGAGDAYRAGILRGLSLSLPWSLSGRIGALTAAYALENVGTQNHSFTPRQFVDRFRTEFDDEGALDALK